MGSSRTRAQTHVPCIGRQILNDCAAREAQVDCFIKLFVMRIMISRSQVTTLLISWHSVWAVIFFFLIFHSFIYLFWLRYVLVAARGIFVAACLIAACGLLSCSMHVGSSSLTRDRTQAPCIGSVESYPLDHQGSPGPLSFSLKHMQLVLFSFHTSEVSGTDICIHCLKIK